MRVVEQEQGRYEVRDIPHGTVYSWRPGRLSVECDCGRVLDLDKPGAACECGAGRDEILKGLDFRNGSDDRPWLEDYEEWREEKEANGVRCEYYAFVETSDG